MSTYEELLQTDELLKRLEQEYDEQWAKYTKAFAEDWPDKLEVEQEVARRGRIVVERWHILRQMGQDEHGSG